jgi:hypothetical protein
MWRDALGTFLSASVEALTTWIEHEYARRPIEHHDQEPAAHIVADSTALADAAALLGVDRLATVDEIRAAFRDCVKMELRSGTFHDQAGDATDERAQRLIAAKNLLIEHATVLEVTNV